MKKNVNVKKITYTALLFSLAMALSYTENLIASLLLLPPGVKLGLANVVVMFALIFMGTKAALTLVILKAGFALLTRGIPAGCLSLFGGVCSFLIICLIFCVFTLKKHYYILSVSGAVAHNLGQLIALSFIFGTSYVFYYAPMLIIVGIIMGFLTSIILNALFAILEKHNKIF